MKKLKVKKTNTKPTVKGKKIATDDSASQKAWFQLNGFYYFDLLLTNELHAYCHMHFKGRKWMEPPWHKFCQKSQKYMINQPKISQPQPGNVLLVWSIFSYYCNYVGQGAL